MTSCWQRIVCGCAALVLSFAPLARAADGPIAVEVRKTPDGKYELLRGGKPYFIKGAGGSWSRETLAKCGGNSFRTWGVGAETQKDLDDAQKNDLTVTLGYWVQHKSPGFSYANAEALKKQLEAVKAAVQKYKNHPAVLAWALGNEMERGNDTPELWAHMEDLAKMVHEVDPNHPTMTVIAELGGQKIQNIHKFCPSIDIIGINSYAGGPTVADRYRKNGGTKPFVITEFGPAGQWESGKNAFGAVSEQTSTEKTRWYRNTYEKAVLGSPGLCLGSYAFIWGFKVEATSTWYGMFLPDGSKLGAVDTMQELWTGKPADASCPVMSTLALTTPNQVGPGETIKAAVEASDAKDKKLKIEWALFAEQGSYGIATHNAAEAQGFKDAIAANGQPGVSIKMPATPGIYRVYCYVRNDRGGAAVGSLPVRVTGPAGPTTQKSAR